VTTCSTYDEEVWLRKIITRLFDLELEVACIFCDNQSCIKLSDNPVFHDRSKHMEVKYHYIYEMIQKGVVKL
jgi:hypothetical protein